MENVLLHYAKAYDNVKRTITPNEADFVDDEELFNRARVFTSSAENKILKICIITSS